ncbi:MAG: C-GCAxxG-C-C family protein [Eubacterium sp.]
MTRGDKAKKLFLDGYNCSQSVVLAFADMLDIEEPMLAKMVSGFGGGIGRRREVCGSVSGMVFVFSLLYGYDNPKDFEGKKYLYGEIQNLTKEFERINGSIICKELLGLNITGPDSPVPSLRDKQYYGKRPCQELVKCSADILENFIMNKE